MILDITQLLDICISDKLIDMVISGQKNKSEDKAVKVRIRPVILKNEIEYQVSEFVGRKVLHSNHSAADVKKKIIDYMTEDFKQAQINMTDAAATILSSKSKTLTCKYKKAGQLKVQRDLSHNRTKKYIIQEGKPVAFMIDLGVMGQDGKIIRTRYDKFRQINRFLEYIEDILPKLDKERELTIIDFGCGKSYLTFAMYYYLKELKGYNIRIIGLDLKADVIEHCNELRTRYGYDKLDFYVGDIATYKDVDKVDMVVTLHACDTATDYALAKAVKWGAEVILSVPCCQHEANRTIKSDILSPVMDYGILKERMAAIVTDAARAKLLTANGYDTQILEFIDMEHTPKNLLIRAVKSSKEDISAREKTKDMLEALNLELTIDKLI
ncbi:MAG: class I SAM-dependent methyltransferase [Lachnospira pectinoschiza]|jgi:SAM-dependent methyltransferase|uniref:methyltransferase n=1 Tax=Lachnospira TaxID=28050 RepID=UPI0006DC89AA|nr:SAM-dependent methyltransferase [Lachnospira sp.]MBS1474382.1 SAM-dependent methyltransferase [Lachnospira sp.]MBS5269659.1 SAM-dependent methyltransferase [Eubacterium sp.]HCS03213.1 SAM-dependent methyltransferase [Eubacterium sp.]